MTHEDLTDEQAARITAMTPDIHQFVTEWMRVSPGETEEARAARLGGTIASPDIVTMPAQIGAPWSTYSNFRSKAEVTRIGVTFPVGIHRETGLTDVFMQVLVDATYTYGDETADVWTDLDGGVEVSLNDAGEIVAVTESFPAIDYLR